jgi:hypothetical protein
MKERPTGIIRTLPSLYMDDKNVGHRKYRRSVAALEGGQIEAIYIALAAVPTQEVLHMYLLIEGEIKLRLNIAGFEPGDARACWDNTIRRPAVWAVCTGPVSRPPEPIKRRGFQGFRYTGDLW